MKYIVTVKETGFADVEVDAEDIYKAEDMVQTMLDDGEVVFDDTSYDYDLYIEPAEATA